MGMAPGMLIMNRGRTVLRRFFVAHYMFNRSYATPVYLGFGIFLFRLPRLPRALQSLPPCSLWVVDSTRDSANTSSINDSTEGHVRGGGPFAQQVTVTDNHKHAHTSTLPDAELSGRGMRQSSPTPKSYRPGWCSSAHHRRTAAQAPALRT